MWFTIHVEDGSNVLKPDLDANEFDKVQKSRSFQWYQFTVVDELLRHS